MINIDDFKIEEKVYKCPICKDKGFIECNEDESVFNHDVEEFDKSESVWRSLGFKTVHYKHCKCQLDLMFRSKLEKAGLGNILHKITTTKYERKYEWQESYYQHAKGFVSNKDRGLIISGQTGSGKTLLLSQMLYNFAVKGHDIMYFDWRRSYEDNLVDRYNVINNTLLDEMLEVEVLYIDDLLKTRNNDMGDLYDRRQEIETAWKIIDQRSVSPNKKTMISTELFEHDFLQLDESLHGRLIELVETTDNWLQMNPKEDRNIRVKKA